CRSRVSRVFPSSDSCRLAMSDLQSRFGRAPGVISAAGPLFCPSTYSVYGPYTVYAPYSACQLGVYGGWCRTGDTVKAKAPGKKGPQVQPSDETLTEAVLVRLSPSEKAAYAELAKKDLR